MLVQLHSGRWHISVVFLLLLLKVATSFNAISFRPTSLQPNFLPSRRVHLTLHSTVNEPPSTTTPTTTSTTISTPSSDTPPQGTPYASLTLGVLSDSHYHPTESRVSITPSTASTLISNHNFTILVESNAGNLAGFPDSMYEDAGCTVVTDAPEVIEDSDIIIKIRAPTEEHIPLMKGKTLISQVSPSLNPSLLPLFSTSKTTVFDLTSVPRLLSRAQSYDTLSSQANIAGYRAVVEASSAYGRLFAGQMTAAGKVPPAKVLVLGVGVAGLAAIQTARNMGAVVRAFDVRPVTKEQVESMGAEFLEVEYEEDGSGEGGYAKEMSDGFKKAQAEMMLSQASDVDIIITTALIPGRKAPILVTSEMLNAMKRGSVIVDLAAANGGNVEASVPDDVVETKGGVTIVGWTDLPSRLPSTSSTLFSNNVANFLLSIGPQTTSVKGYYHIDTEDPAVDNMMIVEEGEIRFGKEGVIKPYKAPEVKKKVEKVVTEEEEREIREKEVRDGFIRNAVYGTIAAALLTGFGSQTSDPKEIALLSTFALAGLAGQQVVWGVAPALHSPLMAVTNAISGMTAVGGMLLLSHANSHSVLPESVQGWMGALAVTLSFVNIAGGFGVSGKMLDLFKRPTDPPDYFGLYTIPASILVGSMAIAGTMGLGSLEGTAGATGVASAVCCILAIAGLSNQETARSGNVIGIAGVGLGLASTVGDMILGGATTQSFAQLATFGGLGTLAGGALSRGVGPTELPQTVAAFHSLVGVAAVAGAIGEYFGNAGNLDSGILACIYGATFIGAITATGSLVAYGKLAQLLSSSPLSLPGRDLINLAGLATVGAGLAPFLSPDMLAPVFSDPEQVRLASLAVATVVSGALGFHLTASIGGADMPVVITVLNSYSGWALVAEGFMLKTPLLTEVGALIGFSGAILTLIMCDAMNRSVVSVILGGAGTKSGSGGGGGTMEIEGSVTTSGVEGLVEAMKEAKSIVVVPGYGMAVAQSQFAVADIAKKMKSEGKDFRFGIHPVAGRMPGQLNVLLAEAGVPYDIVEEMEEINPTLKDTDLVVVIGASDTVNSAAEEDPNCSIAGMPVLKVWDAGRVFVMKRKLGSVGYAGMENPTLFKENVDVVLGDAKDTCEEIKKLL